MKDQPSGELSADEPAARDLGNFRVPKATTLKT